MDNSTAIAFLFGIAAVLSFVNDPYLHIQHDIGLLILACLATAVLRMLDSFKPSVAISLLKELTSSFNLNYTLLKGAVLFAVSRQGVRQMRVLSRPALIDQLVIVRRNRSSVF